MIGDEVNVKWQAQGNRATEQTFSLSAPVLIGRHQDCDIALPDNTISRFHIKVMADPQHIYLINQSDKKAVQIWDKNWQNWLDVGKHFRIQDQVYFQLGGYRLRVRRVPKRRVECSNCHNLVDAERRTCPNCGRDLANARTRFSKD